MPLLMPAHWVANALCVAVAVPLSQSRVEHRRRQLRAQPSSPPTSSGGGIALACTRTEGTHESQPGPCVTVCLPLPWLLQVPHERHVFQHHPAGELLPPLTVPEPSCSQPPRATPHSSSARAVTLSPQDFSGNSLHATLTSGVLSGADLALTATAAYASLPAGFGAALSVSGSYTIMFYIYPYSVSHRPP